MTQRCMPNPYHSPHVCTTLHHLYHHHSAADWPVHVHVGFVLVLRCLHLTAAENTLASSRSSRAVRVLPLYWNSMKAPYSSTRVTCRRQPHALQAPLNTEHLAATASPTPTRLKSSSPC